MNKTVLLELTTREAELVQKLASNFQKEARSESEDFADYDRRVNQCNSIVSKIEESFKPKSEVLMTSKDLFNIISFAKDKYHQIPQNAHISGEEVKESHHVHISIANAMIMWLNGNGLLKNIASFDYTDSSCQYEEND